MKKKVILIFSMIILFSSCTYQTKASESKSLELEKTISELKLENEKLKSEIEISSLKKEVQDLSTTSESQKEIDSLKNSINDLNIKLNEKENLISQKDIIISDAKKEIVTSNDRKKEEGAYLNTEDLLFWLVVRFDHAWIKYINASDNEIFNYVVKDSNIYNIAVNYKKNNQRLKQRMLYIGGNGAEISGNNAKIYVYETVEETDKNNNIVKKNYNWTYTAVKKDGVWYLTEMKKS